MRFFVRSLAVAIPALILASCEDISFGDSDRYKEDFHYSYNVKAGGRLALESFNGSVEIAGTGGNSVEINGTKYANTESALKDLKVDVQQSGDEVRVRLVPPYGSPRNMGGRFSVRVPREFILDRIVTSNGSVRVEDVDGPATLKSSNGSLRVARLKGNLDATTSNSSIETSDLVGNALLHTSNGHVNVEVRNGSLDATTSNSSITARLLDPPDKPVRLQSSNGHIDFQTNVVRDVRADTSNSSITLRLPPNPNARLRARTTNSSISTEPDLTIKGTQSKNSWEGTFGSGGPLLDLSTSNGSIKILRMYFSSEWDSPAAGRRRSGCGRVPFSTFRRRV